jgi:hypothetical protein
LLPKPKAFVYRSFIESEVNFYFVISKLSSRRFARATLLRKFGAGSSFLLAFERLCDPSPPPRIAKISRNARLRSKIFELQRRGVRAQDIYRHFFKVPAALVYEILQDGEG